MLFFFSLVGVVCKNTYRLTSQIEAFSILYKRVKNNLILIANSHKSLKLSAHHLHKMAKIAVFSHFFPLTVQNMPLSTPNSGDIELLRTNMGFLDKYNP